jgi:hypothetical protein
MNIKEMELEAARFEAEHRWDRVERRLNNAIERVMDRDRRLLEDGRSERCVAHRLAVYLEQEFEGFNWHVDCEFNRQGANRDPKRVTASPHLPESRKGTGLADVSPDIIVHQRGADGTNLLIIEVKIAGDKGIPRDEAKLQRYLTEPHLHYTFAALITYRTGSAAGFEPIKPIRADDPLPPLPGRSSRGSGRTRRQRRSRRPG